MQGSKSNEPVCFFVDELHLSAALRLIRVPGLTKVHVLNARKKAHLLGHWLLARRRITVVEADFFAGHLKTSSGESVYFAARRIAGQIALVAAKRITDGEAGLSRLNQSYGRNTIRLFVAKQLIRYIEDWTSRALVAEALSAGTRPQIWLRVPHRFDAELLHSELPNVDLHFYRDRAGNLKDLAFVWLMDCARYVKQNVASIGKSHAPEAIRKPGVLIIQEETIRANHALRGQLHWLDIACPTERFRTHVLKSPSVLATEDGAEAIYREKGVSILPFATMASALRSHHGNHTLRNIRRDRYKAYASAVLSRSQAGRFFLLKVGFLLWQAELMGAMALSAGIKVFLTKEPYSSYTDAMQLVARDLDVMTVALQYSNLGYVSPGMIATVDKFVVFSDMYKAVFDQHDMAPKEFVCNGYLYDGVALHVAARAAKHREALQKMGAQFVVCYFDESVQHDRWGLVSKADHLEELHALAAAVLSDVTFGVVVKSQYMKNSPSQLYPSDELIARAEATGRYLELREGTHRNDVYPTEAALAADFCIGHKFGATAALEASVAGVRTVILDSYGIKTRWDAIYAEANIEFDTIDGALEAVISYRSGDSAQTTLGDWGPILHHFDGYRDGKAVERTMAIVEKCVA